MTTPHPTALEDEFPILQPIWSVGLDNNRTYNWFTADYVNDNYAADAAKRGWPVAYLLQKPRSGGIPIYRNTLGTYSNHPGGTLLGYAEVEPFDGMGPLPINPSQSRERILAYGAHDLKKSLEGYCWALPLASNLYGYGLDGSSAFPYTITSPSGRQDIWAISQAYGENYRWRTIIPSAGIDRDWLWEPDVGAGVSAGEFWDESVTGLLADRMIHNPTLYGCRKQNLLHSPPSGDPNILMWSPPLSIEYGPGYESQVKLDVTTIPLEWSKGGYGNFATRTDDEDHGNDDYTPCIWINCRTQQTQEFNYNGMEGVTRLRFRTYAPVTIDYNGRCTSVCGYRTTDTFDTAYVLDIATDTLTDMGWTGLPDSVSTRWTFSINDTLTETPPGTIIATTASLAPSGYIGVIVRSTGALYGPADDFACGLCCRVTQPRFLPYTAGSKQFLESEIDRIQIIMTHAAAVTPTPTSGFRNAMNMICSGLQRKPGWVGMQGFMVVDTFANVRSKMRQLYLEGRLDNAGWIG